MIIGKYATTGEIEAYALVWRWAEVDMVIDDEGEPSLSTAASSRWAKPARAGRCYACSAIC